MFLVLAAVRLPALWGPINLSPDATEYIDIARNFAAGEGLVLKIRAYFLGDGLGVPYPAAALRGPLFPALLGAVYRVLPSSRVFAWFNFFVFLLNMILLSLILLPLLPGKILAYALLLIGLTEPIFLTSIFPWSEQTAFFWLLLAWLLASHEVHIRWGLAGAILEGAVASLAYLSRPEYILVGALLLVWLLYRTRKDVAILLGFLAGFVPPLAIFFGINQLHYGRTFLPGEYLFRSRDYAVFFTWDTSIGQGAASFLAANWLWIIGRIFRNAVNYFAKLVGWKNLFGFAVTLPLVVWKVLRGQYPWQLRPLALVPMVYFCAYCLVWAGIDRERYLLAITTFLMPLCLMELERWRRETRRPWARRACLVLLAFNLPVSLGYVFSSDRTLSRRAGLGERFYAPHNPAWSNPDIVELASWIRVHVPSSEALCLENPFLVNYLTGRPAIILPQLIRPEDFLQFLNYYRVRYWVDNSVFTKRSAADLERLELAIAGAGAVEVARCGSYRVWRIP